MKSLAKFYKDLARKLDPFKCIHLDGMRYMGKLDRYDQLPSDAKPGDMYEISGFKYIYTVDNEWIKC